MPSECAEQALYIVDGLLDPGRDGSFGAGQLLVLMPGATMTPGAGGGGGVGARVMLL